MTTLGLRTCMVERDELRREVERLRQCLAEHDIDPDEVDLRDPLTRHSEGVQSK